MKISTQKLAILCATLLIVPAGLSMAQTTSVWQGSGSDGGAALNTSANWSNGIPVTTDVTHTARWNGATGNYAGGNLSLNAAANFWSTVPLIIDLTNNQTSSVALTATAASTFWRISGITTAANSGAFSLAACRSYN